MGWGALSKTRFYSYYRSNSLGPNLLVVQRRVNLLWTRKKKKKKILAYDVSLRRRRTPNSIEVVPFSEPPCFKLPL